MFEITKNIYVSSLDGCVVGSEELAVVHACRYPCFNNNITSGAWCVRFGPDPSLQYYHEDVHGFYMKIIDSSLPHFNNEMIIAFLNFSSMFVYRDCKVLIHCNEGKSRAPALAMLLMARLGLINTESYQAAYHEFIVMCPFYRPGTGIKRYLSFNWSKLLK